MIHRVTDGGEAVSDMFLLSESQMERIEPFFPLAHGVARVDDRRVLSGIVYVIRNGLQWKDAPKAYGPHKTLYNRFIRWSRLGVFDRIFVALTEQAGRSKRLMIDATHLKAHRTGSGYRSQNAISLPVFPRKRTGNQSHLTTGICIKSAI